MPATRSSKKIASVVQAIPILKKRARAVTTPDAAVSVPYVVPPRVAEPQLLPPSLSFSLDDAKKHLVSVDPRFQDVFERLGCKPYESLRYTDPFRALVTSILGQQISWLAARSITHRFIRLYFPELPETLPPPGDDSSKVQEENFPTSHQVAATDVATLRSAGLSERKAQYVRDVASRFSDGRLSVDRIMSASDEELLEMLIEIKGVGMWTVHMFSIFSLRRPNILPVGDLGVQRGVARWYYHWHNPDRQSASVPLSPKKLPGTPKAKRRETEEMDVNDSPTAPSAIPPPFTPSIKRTLDKGALGGIPAPPPLPKGLSLADLKARLAGKKVKGAFLTPQEMEELTDCWKPYRSIGAYFMWALAEEVKEAGN